MNLSSPRQDKKILNLILQSANYNKKELYIVGGYLRDMLLGRSKPNPDIDFCLKNNAISFGRVLAKQMKAGFVVLDKDNGSSRMVKKTKNCIYTFDFTDFRGKDLKDDLLKRDFTINSFTLGLKDFLRQKNNLSSLVSVPGALDDLKNKVVRLISEYTIVDDPLRILRAFSFSCVLGFRIEKKTLKLIKANKEKITGVSWERIRDELFKILDTPCAYDCLVELEKLGILGVLFPELSPMRGLKQGPYHHLDIFKHSLETLRQLELIIKSFSRNKDITDYLDEVISGTRSRRALLKLGALLHDIGKPVSLRRFKKRIMFHGHELTGSRIANAIALKLKLSNDEIAILRKMVFLHLRPGYLADNRVVSDRAKFRYFRDAGKEGISVIILSMADQRSTRGPLTTDESRVQHERICSSLIKERLKQLKEKPLVPMLNGNDVMRALKIEPGPQVGRILLHLQELQAIGRIHNRQDALKAARKLL